MKVITIIGARPQFIKVAAVSHRFAQLSDIVEVILHTGQHYDSSMSDIFFNELGIPNPKYNLGIGKNHTITIDDKKNLKLINKSGGK